MCPTRAPPSRPLVPLQFRLTPDRGSTRQILGRQQRCGRCHLSVCRQKPSFPCHLCCRIPLDHFCHRLTPRAEESRIQIPRQQRICFRSFHRFLCMFLIFPRRPRQRDQRRG